MKILIITQWYKPLRAAAANRTSRMAEYLKEKHDITVLTGMPSYPTGILPKKYQRKLWFREKIDGVNVLRTYEFPAENTGIIKRLLNNISFIASALFALCLMQRFDVVIVSSPPFLGGIPGLFSKTIFKCKLVFDIRDLWPDSAIELGFVKEGFLKKILLSLEKKYYYSSDKILTATADIRDHIISEGVPKDRVITLLNTVNTEFFSPQKISRKDFGFKETDFIVAYTGNLGAAQGLENTIKSAEITKKYVKIKYLFVGEGEDKEKLIKLSKKLKLNNVIFWPEKPKEEIVKIINISDVGNIALAPQKIFQQAIPSKALEYFACAKPVVAAVSGGLGKYIDNYEAGLKYDSSDPQNLANAILKLHLKPVLTKKMGQNARKLALDVFSDKTFFRTLNHQFNQVL